MISAKRCAKSIACCVLAGVCSGADAEVTIGDSAEHYRIGGASEAELRREMNAKGPLGAGGRRFDAHTRWNIGWRYKYREDGGTCRIASVTTDVRLTMILPEWGGERAAPERVRKRWREFIAALTAHENGHRTNGIDAAREIDRSISALPAQVGCSAVGNTANALGNQIIRKYNERDLDYDRRTDHGRTQGARFP